METAIEKLKGLRKKYEAMISSCETDIQHAEDEMRRLSNALDGIDASIKELAPALQPDQKTPPLFGKYAQVGMVAAVADVVTLHGIGSGLFVREIMEKLNEEGLKTGAKNLYASVYSVCLRLLEKGKIGESKKNGKRSFVRKT